MPDESKDTMVPLNDMREPPGLSVEPAAPESGGIACEALPSESGCELVTACSIERDGLAVTMS